MMKLRFRLFLKLMPLFSSVSELHADELHTEQVPSGMFTFNCLYPP